MNGFSDSRNDIASGYDLAHKRAFQGIEYYREEDVQAFGWVPYCIDIFALHQSMHKACRNLDWSRDDLTWSFITADKISKVLWREVISSAFCVKISALCKHAVHPPMYTQAMPGVGRVETWSSLP